LRRAVQKTGAFVGELDSSGLKRKRMFVCHPSSHGWLNLRIQRRLHVEIARAGSAAKPFDGATDKKIDGPLFHIDWNLSGGLVNVEQDIGANAVNLMDDAFDVDLSGRFKKDIGKRHDQRAFIDRFQKRVDWHLQTIGGLDAYDFSAAPSLGFEHINQGREV